ncbi:HSP18 transcriptional regulator [Streptomyces sp. NPDC026673]|uniref:HSP18 transcriptional regulator n=1 Tax=Streptomyces sp. NPDC026673 TaxID=3155724 RepID=UPI0033FE2CB5
MEASELPAPMDAEDNGGVSLIAAAAALGAIDRALRDARSVDTGLAPNDDAGQALASLMLLREVREQLAGWERGLIETARAAGASWADLASPLGVASRQAAERRYLRLQPGAAGSTGEARVKATRDRRAADRTVTAWARDNAADLRRLAAHVTGLTDLPPGARSAIADIDAALAHDDAARLMAPLEATRDHLQPRHPEVAARVDALTRHAEQLRQESDDQRRSSKRPTGGNPTS